jgi:phytoene dehydrogenase-like protein
VVAGHLGTPRTPWLSLCHYSTIALGALMANKVNGHAIGGMGSITQAMVQACEQLGVGLHRDEPVHRRSVHDRGRARGR